MIDKITNVLVCPTLRRWDLDVLTVNVVPRPRKVKMLAVKTLEQTEAVAQT